MSSQTTFSGFLFFLLFFAYCFIPLAFAEDDYDIEVDDSTKIIWEIDTFNETLIDQLIVDSDYYDDDDFEDLEEGYQEKWLINDVTQYEDSDENEYYTLTLERYDREDEDEDWELDGEYITHVALDPGELADDYSDGGGADYGLLILPVDIDDFLDEFADEIDSADSDRVYSSGSKIIINRTVDGDPELLKLEYTEDGILEDFYLYVEGDLAYHSELVEVGKHSNNSFNIVALIIIIVVLASVAAIVIVVIVVVIRKLKKPDTSKSLYPAEEQKPDEIIAPPLYSQPESVPVAPIPLERIDEARKIGYCPLCGFERDEDAKFCPDCGNRF